MLKFVLLSIVFLAQLQSKEYRLEYGFEVGQKLKYDFSGSHKARFVTYDSIKSAEEKLIGSYEDEVMEITSDVQAKILRKFRIASRQHNGDFKDLNDLASKGLEYIYYLDPQKGKVKVLDSSTFDPKDLMEMVVSFPQKTVAVNDTWAKTYTYNLSNRSAKIEVDGRYKLVAVRGNIARVEGKFQAKIPMDSKTEYLGKLNFEVVLFFNMRKGLIEKGSFRKILRYESRSKVAKAFLKESRAAGKETRLGYTLKMNQDFQRVKDDF